MRVCEKIILSYKVGYRDQYDTNPFSIQEIVRVAMEKIPEVKDTKILNGEFEKTEHYNKKGFEKLCLEMINRNYAHKGLLNKQTLVSTADVNWDGLIKAINTAFYQLKREPSRFEWRTLRGYRLKVGHDTPPEIRAILAGNDVIRNISNQAKSMERELTYEEKFCFKPIFADVYKKNIQALDRRRLGGIQ